HLISNATYRTLPAKLRMNVIGAPGIEKADFELYSLGVSAVNGCGMCLDAHEAELRKHGLSTEQIQAGIRIGAVVNAVARVLAAEAVAVAEPA
ncbi:carboxymuconolactone decarboxylase family protein, partial [Hyphomonas sp.]